MNTSVMETDTLLTVDEQNALERARRTAFVARFIVLREGKKSKAHREIEQLSWERNTKCLDLVECIRKVFREHGDNMSSVERDIKRAIAHADRLNPMCADSDRSELDKRFCLWQLVEEYDRRSTSDFIAALFDYERSNSLLFGEEEQPKIGGWRLPQELVRQRERDAKDRATAVATAANGGASQKPPKAQAISDSREDVLE